MAGSATFTAVASSPATNEPRIAARSARRLRRSVTRDHATEERTCVRGGSGGWAPARPQTARDAVPNRLGCSPPRPPPRGQVTASERRGPPPPRPRLRGLVPRHGGRLGG